MDSQTSKVYRYPEGDISLPETIFIDGKLVRPDWVEVTTFSDAAKGQRAFISGLYEIVEPELRGSKE